jgi:Tfp pilus assembly protein PilV
MISTAANNVVDIKTSAANRLMEINSMRKQLEREETELKNMFKSSGISSFETDMAIILVSEKSRESLDRAALEVKLGSEVVQEFVKTTTYLQVDVKKK